MLIEKESTPMLSSRGAAYKARKQYLTNKIVIKPARTLRGFKGLLKNRNKEEDFDGIRKKLKSIWERGDSRWKVVKRLL